MYKVSKPFHTMNRRFSVNDPVGPNDIQGAVSFEIWMERGFIAAEKGKAPVAKPAKSDKEAAAH